MGYQLGFNTQLVWTRMPLPQGLLVYDTATVWNGELLEVTFSLIVGTYPMFAVYSGSKLVITSGGYYAFLIASSGTPNTMILSLIQLPSPNAALCQSHLAQLVSFGPASSQGCESGG